MTCSQEGKCLSVADGKYIDNGGATTANCVDVVAQCSKCTLDYPTTCLNCTAGYYYDSDDQTCHICEDDLDYSCDECYDSQNCTKCKAGYLLDVNTCISCSSILRKCS